MKEVIIRSKIVGKEGAIGGGKPIAFPDMSAYALRSDLIRLESSFNEFLEGDDTDNVINRWKELEEFLNNISEDYNLLSLLNGKADKSTTLSGYGITDAYTKTNVDDLLKSYVTLGGTPQTITGEKNFTGGLKVNGSPIYYDTEKKYWKLEGDLLVTGGVTMYGGDSSFTPSTIMDAIVVDGTTISKDGGVLKINPELDLGGLDEAELEGYLTVNKYVKESALTEALSTYATQAWVNARGYATTSDLDSRINALVNGAPAAYDTLKEIADVLQGNVNSIGDIIATLGTKWTQDGEKIANWDTAYGWGNHANAGYALKSYVDGNFVTLATDQTISGLKNFSNGLELGGISVYKSQDGVLYLDGNLVVKGGVTMYSGGLIDAPTIMDAIVVDGTTISKDGGVLKVIGGTGGGVADSVAWANITGKPTFASVATSGKYSDLSGTPSSLPASDVYSWAKAANKPSYTWSEITSKPTWIGSSKPTYSYSEITGAISTTELQNYLTSNSYLNVTTGDNRYLKLSGGRLSGNDSNILELYRTNEAGGAWVDYYAANQSSIYWRVGSSNEHTFRWEYTSGVISMTLNSLGVLSTKGFESLYANIGYVFGHQDVNRAIISIISTADSPAEVILGGSSVNYWSMTSRGTSQTSNYWLYNYNKRGTNLEADYNSFSIRVGKGNQQPYTALDSTYTLDVCGKTRTTSLYGASEQLNIVAASGYNTTLRSNGGVAGFNIALDVGTQSFRPFTDSHVLLDLGSSNIYWRNIYSQKLILKSPSADALSIYRTISGGGAFADFYPSDQTENYWRIGALNDYNCAFLFNGGANTNHVSIAPQGHLSIGHTLSHTNNERAELSVVSIKDAPCDIMLGSNKSAHWSISSRDSSMNNNLVIHSYQGTKKVFEINKDGCCRIGENSSWTAPTSTITLDVLGSTRTNNIYGTDVNLALISATGKNVELQANGQLAGYKVCLDVTTQSFRPFTDSHALIDLGSEKVYWKNIYAQKCSLTSNDAGALSLYRTNEYGVYIDYYPSNQKVNKWRVGAAPGGVFQWENYNGQIVGRFASSSTTGTRFEVGKSFLNIQDTGSNVDRAVITLISESDYPTEIIMGANKYAWSITTRNSAEDYLLGFYSGISRQYAMKIYKEGNVLVTGGITMYSDQRKKTILNHVELSLKQIADAPLIEHYYNSDEKKTTHVGSIAQYWASMNDWFCKLDSEGFYTMEIQNAALASAISIARELDRYETKTDKAIKKLKKRICELEEEVERLKSA